MLDKAQKLIKANQRAREIIDKLSLTDNSEQWNYKLMKEDIKQTYTALKKAWSKGDNLDTVRDYLSEQAYKMLLSDSRLGNTDLKYLDLLDCFDCELEDFVIISVMNFPDSKEDYFVVWLDNEYSSEKINIDNIEGDNLKGFGLTDNFSNLSGCDVNLMGMSIFKLAPNNCWTFKWSGEKWVLHNIAFDNSTNSYLQILGKNFSFE